jgi:hypothetical protein
MRFPLRYDGEKKRDTSVIMDWDRRTFTAGLAGSAFFTAFAGVSRAQQLEKPSLRLGVGNKSHLYYLPLTLAERRG